MGIFQTGYLYDIFFFSSFPALVLAIFYYSRLSPPIIVLCLYLLASNIIELVAHYFSLLYADSFWYIQCNFFPQVALLFYAFYFMFALQKDWLKRVIPNLGFFTIFFVTGYIALFSSFSQDNSPVTLAATNLYLLIGAIAQYYQFIRSIAEYQLERLPLFYVSSGLLFYATSAILVQVGITLIISNKEDVAFGFILWEVGLVSWIVFNIFLLYAIILEIRQWDPSLPSSS